MIHDEVVTEK